MAYQVWLDFGAGWEDITSRLYSRLPVTRTRAVHAKGDPSKPVIGTARFKIVRDTVLVNRFLSASGSVAVKIQKDGAAYFLGQIRDTPKTKADLMALERFEVECVDALMRLEKRCTVSATWSGYSVSSPSNKAASVLHQLLYAAGFADVELNLAAISITIDRFSLDKTRGETYRQIFERILLETGFSGIVSPAGVVELYDLGPASVTPTATLSTGSAGNIAKGFEIAKNEAKAEAVDVSYWSHLTLTDAVLFEDTTGGGALPCSIPLTAGSYYPQGADATHDVRAELKLSDYEIIAVDSAAVEWDHTGDVVKQVEVIEGLGVRIRFYSATGGVLTKLRIRGNALVRGDLYKVIRENVASTEKRESLELSTIYTAAAAERVAIIRANWHANSRFDHVFPEITLLSLAPGDYVQLTDTAILGSSQVLRVVQIEDGGDPLSIKILCEGASAYSYVALPRTIESGRPTPDYPPAIGGTPIEIIADRTPPSIPAGVSSSQLSTGALRVGFSASVDIESGVSHYRIYRREQGSAAEGVVAQVLDDGSGSYIVDDTSPVVGKSYEFAVSAVDKRGNESALSAWTAALASVVTDAPPNVAGTPTAKASSALMVVTWAVVNGAVAYRVERSTDSGSTWPTSFTAAANRLEDPIAAGVEIAALAAYRYRVKALSIYQALSAAWATSGAPDTTGYGTYVPAAPTVSFAVAKRTLSAEVVPQANLINPDGWDVQISRDNANWYCPNLAAKVDADGWYTGALNAFLKINSPSFRLNYLPIPTSGTPALPAEAGQGYYLRVRARCSSPAAQSGWTTSAALTVTPTLGIDFAAAQVYGQILKAGGVLMDRLSVLARNYVNNPTLSGNVNGWGAILEDGSGTSAITSYDATEKALKITSAASHAVRCLGFEIDHSKIYKIVVRVKKSAASGMAYVGLTAEAGALAAYEGTGAGNGAEFITPIDPVTRAAGTPVANFYNKSWAAGSSPTAYELVTFYVLGALVSIDEMPKGISGYICAKLAATTNRLALRFLNWSNSVSTNLFIRDISVSEVGAGTVVAENIYAIALSAINANLGEITAGKAYSVDYDPGVAGFVIDLDTGEIRSESGGWSISSDGSVMFADGTIGPLTIDALRMFLGDGGFGGATTPFYADNEGKFSLGDKLRYTPEDGLHIGANLSATGDNIVMGAYESAVGSEDSPTAITSGAGENVGLTEKITDSIFLAPYSSNLRFLLHSATLGFSTIKTISGPFSNNSKACFLKVSDTKVLGFALDVTTLSACVLYVSIGTLSIENLTISWTTPVSLFTYAATSAVQSLRALWGKADKSLVAFVISRTNTTARLDVFTASYTSASDTFGTVYSAQVPDGTYDSGVAQFADFKLLLFTRYSATETRRIVVTLSASAAPSFGAPATHASDSTFAATLNSLGTKLRVLERDTTNDITRLYLQSISAGVLTWSAAIETVPIAIVPRFAILTSAKHIFCGDNPSFYSAPDRKLTGARTATQEWGMVLIPEKLGVGIEEIGSNSNGSYVKFSDGTLICYGRHTNATYPQILTYPWEFLDTTYALLVLPATGANILQFTERRDDHLTTGANVWLFGNGAAWAVGGELNWFAFGRWK